MSLFYPFATTDAYVVLIFRAVERKASGLDVNDLGSMGRHWVELSKLRTKTKRDVDTKASKGTGFYTLFISSLSLFPPSLSVSTCVYPCVFVCSEVGMRVCEPSSLSHLCWMQTRV